MTRIAYKPNDIAAPRKLVESIRVRRGGHLLNLDRMLLHSPPLARGWNVYLRAVRTEFAVLPKLRELAICTVAALNGADYEFIHHAPEFLQAGGSDAQLAALRQLPDIVEDPELFDATERAVIHLTIEMTRTVRVSDETFALARAALASDQTMVEMIGVIAAYNMVSRFLVALEIETET
jgi:alkylhydroperoxidase family enzyme